MARPGLNLSMGIRAITAVSSPFPPSSGRPLPPLPANAGVRLRPLCALGSRPLWAAREPRPRRAMACESSSLRDARRHLWRGRSVGGSGRDTVAVYEDAARRLLIRRALGLVL